jgi:hypothetical protein
VLRAGVPEDGDFVLQNTADSLGVLFDPERGHEIAWLEAVALVQLVDGGAVLVKGEKAAEQVQGLTRWLFMTAHQPRQHWFPSR